MTRHRGVQPANSSETRGASPWEASLRSAKTNTSGLTVAEAPFVREALVRAQTLRVIREDPGDAYMQGVTDAFNYVVLQRDAEKLSREFQTDATEPPVA